MIARSFATLRSKAICRHSCTEVPLLGYDLPPRLMRSHYGVLFLGRCHITHTAPPPSSKQAMQARIRLAATAPADIFT